MTETYVVRIVSYGTLVLAVVVGAAHALGFLEPVMTWLKDYGPVLAAVLFSMIAIILNHVSARLDGLQSNLDRVDSVNLSRRLQQLQDKLEAINLPEIRQFNSPHDIYQYWTQRLEKAKRSVDDLTWGHYPPHYTATDKEALKTYVAYIPEVCGRNIRYREVMTFPNIERVTRARDMLDHKIHNYHLRYYDLGNHKSMPPLMQFSVIDSEEVFIFFYREPGSESGSDELRLAIRHPVIVKLFADYFDSIWRVATKLKQGDDVDKNLLDKIQAAVEKYSPPQKPAPASPASASQSKTT